MSAATEGARPAAESGAGVSRQAQMPFAVVQGAPVLELPKDLYIPPDALEVFLEAFEGPLDLLLYLIRRQGLDILDIPIAEVTHQYIEYVDLMRELRLELAAEYLVMAAMLAEIKARMLMPKREDVEEEEEDPRALLVRRLQDYERYKLTAEMVDALPRVGREIWTVTMVAPDVPTQKLHPPVELADLLYALRDILRRAEMFSSHQIQLEPLSVRERMSGILAKVTHDRFSDFTSLFTAEEGKRGAVVTLLAILELLREQILEISQTRPFGPIRVRALA
ncbi:MAG: segregation/condensation protein A [Gammaproteobacteria bacterium]|nr:segregation/condensation protein A [Gammaproteobacteria bacterium]